MTTKITSIGDAKKTRRNAHNKTTHTAIKAIERAAQALELRKAGVGYQAIADRLGYADHSGAHRAVMSALHKTLREPADELRELEVERLDRLLFGLWTKAISGDTWAVDRVLKIMERRATLLGLDAPKKIENTGANGGAIAIEMGARPDFSQLTSEEKFKLDQLLARVVVQGGELVATESE